MKTLQSPHTTAITTYLPTYALPTATSKNHWLMDYVDYLLLIKISPFRLIKKYKNLGMFKKTEELHGLGHRAFHLPKRTGVIGVSS